MILSQRQLEEIAASTTKDFNRFFFGDEADKPDRSALPTPIDQFAKNYLGLRVSFARLLPDGSICGVTAYKGVKNQHIDREEWIVFPNTHEAIISREDFQKVREMRNAAARTRVEKMERTEEIRATKAQREVWK